MAVQAIHGLVRGGWRQDLTGQPVQGQGDQTEIDTLAERIADTRLRLRLRLARDVTEVGESLALIYRCEDRIKDIKRSSQRRQSTRAPHPTSCRPCLAQADQTSVTNGACQRIGGARRGES